MGVRAKKVLVFAVALFIILFAAGLIVGNYFYNLALSPSEDKSGVLGAPHNTFERRGDESLANIQWVSNESTDIYMTSNDGLNLHAYILEQDTARWAIVSHGYMSNGNHMFYTAKEFYDMGYNVLIPDARGHGLSEGDYIGMGWHDRLDILAWINTLIAAKGARIQIVLYGVSMGGATVMMVSGEDLPPNVRAIVEDCGYSSVDEEFAYQFDKLYGLPAFPILNFGSLIASLRAGYSFGEANAMTQVAKSTTPILFIHGEDDTFVPSYMLERVFDAANCEKQKLLVPGAGHGGASIKMGDEYWRIVEVFLNKYVDEV